MLTLATAVAGASAAFQGFNYDNKGKDQQTFEAEFKNAQNLEGTDGGFTSARLYTMIQDGTANDPISAIPAAISTKTSLLFGLWASGGQAAFDNELAALKKTIDQYCGQLDGLVAGISVGSEDLYRDSPTGRAYGENPGVGPDVLSKYVDETRKTIKGSCLADAPIGHVDTWTAYANETNRPFSDKLDWVGMDAYPYYENKKDNSIDNAVELFQAALDNTNAGTGNKPLWITETGWPVSGKTEKNAESGLANAKTFWQKVGCPRFGKVNTWWFTMEDGGPSTDDAPRFGIIGADLTTKPLFDLSCKGHEDGGSDSTSSSATATATTATSSETETETEQPTTTQSETTATEQPTESTGESSSVATTSDAPVTETTPAPTMTTLTGTGGVQPGTSQPAGGSGSNGGASGSSTGPATTPTQVDNGAAGLNSVAAAAAAIMVAVAAF